MMSDTTPSLPNCLVTKHTQPSLLTWYMSFSTTSSRLRRREQSHRCRHQRCCHDRRPHHRSWPPRHWCSRLVCGGEASLLDAEGVEEEQHVSLYLPVRLAPPSLHQPPAGWSRTCFSLRWFRLVLWPLSSSSSLSMAAILCLALWFSCHLNSSDITYKNTVLHTMTTVCAWCFIVQLITTPTMLLSVQGCTDQGLPLGRVYPWAGSTPRQGLPLGRVYP